MANDEAVREKLREAFRLLAEVLAVLEPPDAQPKLTLYVNDGSLDPNHAPMPACDSELKKIRRRPPYPRPSGKSFTRPGQRQGIGKK